MSLFKPKNLTPGLNSDVSVLERGIKTLGLSNEYMGEDPEDTEIEFSCVVDGNEEITNIEISSSVDMKLSLVGDDQTIYDAEHKVHVPAGYCIRTRPTWNNTKFYWTASVDNENDFYKDFFSTIYYPSSTTYARYPLQGFFINPYVSSSRNEYRFFNVCTFGDIIIEGFSWGQDSKFRLDGSDIIFPENYKLTGFLIRKNNTHSTPHLSGDIEKSLTALTLKNTSATTISFSYLSSGGIFKSIDVEVTITRVGYTQIKWEVDINKNSQLKQFMQELFKLGPIGLREVASETPILNIPILFIGKPSSKLFTTYPIPSVRPENENDVLNHNLYWLNKLFPEGSAIREYMTSGSNNFNKQVLAYSLESFQASYNTNVYPVKDNSYNEIIIPLSLKNIYSSAVNPHENNIPSPAGAYFRGALDGDEYKFNYSLTVNGKYGSKATSHKDSFYLITNTPTFSWELWNDLGYYYIHINEDKTNGQIEKWRYKYYISSEELVAGQTSLKNKILKHTSEWKQGAPYNNYVFTDIQTVEPSIKYISIELELIFKNSLTKIVPLSNNGKDFIGMAAEEMSDFIIDLTEMPEMGGMYIEVNTDNPSKFVSKRYNKLTNKYEDYMKPLYLQRVEIINGERVITDLTYNLIYGHNGFTRDDGVVIAPELAVPIIDYGIKNNIPFFYRIIAENSTYQTEHFFNSIPLYQETDMQKMEFDKWIMYLTKDKSSNFVGFYEFHQDRGPYRNIEMPYQSVDKILYFDLNINSGSITNNNQVTIVKNFTPYPTVQKAPSYYWSGTLKSLLGYIALNNMDYMQTPTMLKDYKELSSTEYKKFLKDMDGNLWQIEINGAIQIENNDKLADIQLKTKSVPWVEVADASRTSLIQVAGDNQEYVLQEEKYSNPLIKYAWFDEKYWDDNLIWSESEVQ